MKKTGFQITFNDDGLTAVEYLQPTVIENNDLFIDNRTGKILGHLGTGLGDIRIIRSQDWDYANDTEEIPTEKEKIDSLIADSIIVTIDDNQIQNKMQEIHSLTKEVEYQVYIVLSKEGKIKAVRGEDGIDSESEIISFAYKDALDYPTVKVEGVRYILLAQVHTHNLKKNVHKSNTFGGSTIKNDFGPSKKDKETAGDLEIPIYNIDSWNKSSSKAQVTIGRVFPNKKQETSVATTKGGKGKEHSKHLDIGKEALNYRIKRYDPKLIR